MNDRLLEVEDLLETPAGIEKLRVMAAAGNADAMFVLALAYYDGEVRPADSLRCAELLEEASRRGHIEATHNLGCFRYYGFRFPADFVNHEAAARLLEISAGESYTPSMTFLGSMYANGEGVKQDLARARELYKRAAELGDENGKDFLSRLGA